MVAHLFHGRWKLDGTRLAERLSEPEQVWQHKIINVPSSSTNYFAQLIMCCAIKSRLILRGSLYEYLNIKFDRDEKLEEGLVPGEVATERVFTIGY